MATSAITALMNVMADVDSLGKTGYNQSQRFSFRSIDDLMNKLGPALRKHRLVLLPQMVQYELSQYLNAKGTTMQRVIVTMDYTFMTEDGDELTIRSVGEGSDLGDKATSKAMSMAMKYGLIQALCLPTNEADPDGENPGDVHPSHNADTETEADRALEVREKISEWGAQNDVSLKDLAAEFFSEYKVAITNGTLDQLNKFYTQKALGAEVKQEDSRGGDDDEQ